MSEPQLNRRKGIALGRSVSSGVQEVIDAPFPDRRTIHWMPSRAYQPDAEYQNSDFAIVITSDVIEKTNRHVSQTLERELGGFLLGNRYHCPNTKRDYIVIDQYLEADYTEGTDVSLTFTHDSWAQLTDQLHGKFYGKQLVGWYHSHPRMNIFLSAHDVIIHQNRFPDNWKCALVIEPEKRMGGFFGWHNGELDPNHYVEFYEMLESEARHSVVDWINYQGFDPVRNSDPVIKTGIGQEPALTSGAIKLPGPGAKPSNTSGSTYLLMGAVILVALLFVSALTYLVVSKFIIGGPASADNTNQSRPDNKTPAGSASLSDIETKPEGGEVSFSERKFTVRLKLSKVPQDIAANNLEAMETIVYIGGVKADEVKKDSRGQIISASSASPQLKDEIEKLKANKSVENLKIKATYSYGGSSKDYETTIALVKPMGNNDGIARLKFEDKVQPQPQPQQPTTPAATTKPPTTRIPIPAIRIQGKPPCSAADRRKKKC